MGNSRSKRLAARVIPKLPKSLKGVAKGIVKKGPGYSEKGKKIVDNKINKLIWGGKKR